MAKKLKRLRLTEVSLVAAGANQFADISIFKRADQSAETLDDTVSRILREASARIATGESASPIIKHQKDPEMSNILNEIQKYADTHKVTRELATVEVIKAQPSRSDEYEAAVRAVERPSAAMAVADDELSKMISDQMAKTGQRRHDAVLAVMETDTGRAAYDRAEMAKAVEAAKRSQAYQ
ncbi:hypothetical protein [Aminobacter aminovorans]|uniref:hypothetical protein n=1 Tax=Aminobacter aminovorans TaxID=83263 RepID=UPI0028554338|nr:hypothetical protein [Aminobacter aminovorans]MDR7219863.1 hypothetical protein [Aminobacter aminovorans]WMC95381.1 hypothetical protein RAR13_18625 [Aminobacter aminovorans]